MTVTLEVLRRSVSGIPLPTIVAFPPHLNPSISQPRVFQNLTSPWELSKQQMGPYYPSTAADAYQAVNATITIVAQILIIPCQFRFTCKDVIAKIKSAALNFSMEIK
jgi:hypothetical protein